jgi:hypothetical protein
MTTKKKKPVRIGKVFKVTVFIATQCEENIDDYEVTNAVCDSVGRLRAYEITEKDINEV